MSNPTDPILLPMDVKPVAEGGEKGDIAIPLSGQITRRDLVRGYLLFHRPSPLGWALRIGIAALVVALGVAFRSYLGVREMFWYNAVAALILLVSPWLSPYLQASQQWSSNATLHEPSSGLATAQGLHSEGATFRSDVAWDLFVMFKRSADVVLLYQTPRYFNVFPRSLFAANADWEAFGRLVESNVPKQLTPGKDPGATLRKIALAIGVVVLIALLVWMLQRRPDGKEAPPLETARLVQAARVSRGA